VHGETPVAEFLFVAFVQTAEHVADAAQVELDAAFRGAVAAQGEVAILCGGFRLLGEFLGVLIFRVAVVILLPKSATSSPWPQATLRSVPGFIAAGYPSWSCWRWI